MDTLKNGEGIAREEWRLDLKATGNRKRSGRDRKPPHNTQAWTEQCLNMHSMENTSPQGTSHVERMKNIQYVVSDDQVLW